MGADLIGFRGCPLQAGLGVGGFVDQLRLLKYKRAAMTQVSDAAERGAIQIRVNLGERPGIVMSYGELCDRVEGFETGIPECTTCPLSAGQRLGCHVFVHFPVDASFEEHVFDVVVRHLGLPGSAGARFYHELLLRFEGEPSAWTTRRGREPGSFAERTEPKVHRWTEAGKAHRLSSAEILDGLFTQYEDAEDMRIQCELLAAMADGMPTSFETAPDFADIARLCRAILAGPRDWSLLVDA